MQQSARYPSPIGSEFWEDPPALAKFQLQVPRASVVKKSPSSCSGLWYAHCWYPTISIVESICARPNLKLICFFCLVFTNAFRGHKHRTNINSKQHNSISGSLPLSYFFFSKFLVQKNPWSQIALPSPPLWPWERAAGGAAAELHRGGAPGAAPGAADLGGARAAVRSGIRRHVERSRRRPMRGRIVQNGSRRRNCHIQKSPGFG